MNGWAVAKIVVGGGPGAGTSTFVRAASEIVPLDCDVAGAGSGAERSRGTVGLDFGRVTIPPGLVLHLFGLPSRTGGRLLWGVAAAGACGAVVLVDGEQPAAGLVAVRYAARLGVPWMVAVNRRAGRPAAGPRDVAPVLATTPDVPVVSCDARSRESARACLGVLVGVLRTCVEARATRPTPPAAAGLDAGRAPAPLPVAAALDAGRAARSPAPLPALDRVGVA